MIARLLKEFIAYEVKKTGFQRVVICLSEGIHSTTTTIVEPLLQIFPQTDQVRRCNVITWERMIILYHQSKEQKTLVLGTGNKTQYLLG